MEQLKKAVEKTLNYAEKFGQRLNSDQMVQRLLTSKIYTEKEIKKIYKAEVKSKHDFWQEKVNLATKLVKKHLTKIDGILMVGITGSVAAEAAGEADDIDLMIVTRKDELWWWRLYLRIYIRLKNIPHRIYNLPERKDEFCFNLWLDEEHLEIPYQKKNLKNALDLVMMKPIYEKEDIYQKFIEKNGWVKKYVATGYERLIRKADKKEKEDNRSKWWKRWLNLICFLGQYWYMSGKRKMGYVKIGQAFFHEDNK